MSQHDWNHLWLTFQRNRKWAAEIAPNLNRCAIVMSATLHKRPRPGEHSLKDVVADVATSIRNSPSLNHFYIRSQELANRLEHDWGTPPIRSDVHHAKRLMEGKIGVVFFEDAYAGGVDHIDLFNGRGIACRLTLNGEAELTGVYDPFHAARRIWFWPRKAA